MARPPNQSTRTPRRHPGHYLKEWRDFRGWSQEDLAEKLSERREGTDLKPVAHPKISRIESGKTALKLDFADELASVIGIPRRALMEINPADPEGAEVAEMLTYFPELPPEERRLILKQIRALRGAA